MKKPVVIHADQLDAPAETVTEAPPVPEPDGPAQAAAMPRAVHLASRRMGPLGRLALWAAGGLVGMMLSLAVWDAITGLLARHWILGQTALVLSGIVAVALVVWMLREISAIARLGRIDALQTRAAAPEARRDRSAALGIVGDLDKLYAHRSDLQLPLQTLRGRTEQILDADALLDTAEVTLLAPIDDQARREIEAAARQVAAATALIPLALADVVVALASNIRMIRRIATLYSGRAGMLGSWRLLRAVAQHLVATGAVAVGDDMIGSIAGGGALAKVSRRFGEGVINGALTARVGVAAMEVCRPLPFSAAKRPRVTGLMKRAMTGLFGNG